MNATPGAPPSDCWNVVGVWGDGSCPELEMAVHCQNCPVYAAAGRALLHRPPPEGYVEERSRDLAQPQEDRPAKADCLSAVLFRIGEEWAALPTALFREATRVLPVHSLPHRVDDVLLGLVNVRGELLPCVSAARLLRLAPGGAASALPPRQKVYPRMAVVESEGRRWAFPVDEILGVQTVRRADLRPPPATLSRAEQPFTSHLFAHEGRTVALLDGELFFHRLGRVGL